MINIILIGFMGVGKSTIGRVLARQLSYNFIDTDEKIKEIAGIEIPDIFRIHGEEYFRRLEYEAIISWVDHPNTVISTGGGAVMNKQLFDILLSKGLVIHLEASLSTLYDRLRDSDDRPMLHHDEPKKRIEDLYKLRYPTYMRAHYTIKTDNKSVIQITNEIMDIIRREDN